MDNTDLAIQKMSDKLTESVKESKNPTLFRKENLFTLVVYNYIVEENSNYKWSDLPKQFDNFFVNGSNDGGIDMIYYDESSTTFGFIQTKLSKNVTVNSTIAEIDKTVRTIEQLKTKDFKGLSETLRRKYLDVMDRVSDDDEISYEIIFAATSDFDKDKVRNKAKLPVGIGVSIYPKAELDNKIRAVEEGIQRVADGKIELINKIPKNNVNEYQSKTMIGVSVSAKASSIKDLYDHDKDNGLFDLNVRKFVTKRAIDKGIVGTIHKHPSEFWFLNNGLTIATSAYEVDGDNIKLHDFSVVNGAQTTTLIGENFKLGSEDFPVPVKVIAPLNPDALSDIDKDQFFSDISEATNSQKPIKPQDLKANTRELRMLQKGLGQFGIFLKIKQGTRAPKGSDTIKVDDLAKLIYSFVNQLPGSARSSVRSLFESKEKYDSIFLRPGYDQSQERLYFVRDLISLSDKVSQVQGEVLSTGDGAVGNTTAIYGNGKLSIIALLGAIYQYINDDAKNVEEINNNDNYHYGKFIDDTEEADKSLKAIIIEAVSLINAKYEAANALNPDITVTNYLKKDKSYQSIVQTFISNLSALKVSPTPMQKALYENYEVLKRK